MNLLRRLFGGTRKQASRREILHTLQQFIQAGSWNESRCIIEQHPESFESQKLMQTEQILD